MFVSLPWLAAHFSMHLVLQQGFGKQRWYGKGEGSPAAAPHLKVGVSTQGSRDVCLHTITLVN